MKKCLLMFVFLLTAACSYAQDWIKAAESDDAYYYINSTLRHKGSYYIAFEKYVPKDINAERRHLVNHFEDNKWYRYAYHVTTIYVDIELYRAMTIHTSFYDTSGNVFDGWDSTDDNWRYATPNTILEGICETVEYIAKYK